MARYRIIRIDGFGYVAQRRRGWFPSRWVAILPDGTDGLAHPKFLEFPRVFGHATKDEALTIVARAVGDFSVVWQG